jgi:hypothetical protein
MERSLVVCTFTVGVRLVAGGFAVTSATGLVSGWLWVWLVAQIVLINFLLTSLQLTRELCYAT